MQRWILTLGLLFPLLSQAQEEHHHPAPEKLGTVAFPIACSPQSQQPFNRAVALLHSFAYKDAEQAFQAVAQGDPQCAIAHWGIAMTHFHQLWDVPPSPADAAAGQSEIRLAESRPEASLRERGFIHALGAIFNEPDTPYSARALHYEDAMRALAAANPGDTETQVFYALALISNASPTDKEHRRQKQAESLLEPLYRQFPEHPGIAHYLIHACDNQELASRGLPAARAYAKIAPSAPHALHMPSHIFTRLGLWDDSVASNLAARKAAHRQGDIGEELHAMDYLVYAYLQNGSDAEAQGVIQQLQSLTDLNHGSFKIGYAATAMPVRYLIERHRWNEAEAVSDPPSSASPQVTAIAVWARALGFARSGDVLHAQEQAETLRQLAFRLTTAGNTYWATQVDVMSREAQAWSAQAAKSPSEAATLMRSAAEEEDAVEKLPVTPGPIVPAREQLGDLLLEQGNAPAASEAFHIALVNAPGRRGAQQGAARAAALLSSQGQPSTGSGH